ncbi:MAG: hypothetical protein ACLFTD_11445, partial [Halochromatium sp.]
MSTIEQTEGDERRAEVQREKEKVRQKADRGEGVGWGGKTLREQLAELEDKTAATDHYAGLEELELKREDPIRYEQMFSQLRGGLVTARETSKEVAATPIVEQEGELCYGLFTPEGDSIAVSTG